MPFDGPILQRDAQGKVCQAADGKGLRPRDTPTTCGCATPPVYGPCSGCQGFNQPTDLLLTLGGFSNSVVIGGGVQQPHTQCGTHDQGFRYASVADNANVCGWKVAAGKSYSTAICLKQFAPCKYFGKVPDFFSYLTGRTVQVCDVKRNPDGSAVYDNNGNIVYEPQGRQCDTYRPRRRTESYNYQACSTSWQTNGTSFTYGNICELPDSLDLHVIAEVGNNGIILTIEAAWATDETELTTTTLNCKYFTSFSIATIRLDPKNPVPIPFTSNTGFACADLSSSGTNNNLSSPGVYPNPISPSLTADIAHNPTPCEISCGNARKCICSQHPDGTPDSGPTNNPCTTKQFKPCNAPPPAARGTGGDVEAEDDARPVDTRSGPDRWAWLHERAGKPIADPQAERDAILALANDLPGCSCQYDWAAEMKDFPPPVDDPAAMPRWSYDRHDHVNERIGGPRPTYAEVAAFWGWPPE